MFKDVLKQLRIEKGLTQLQLAEVLGLQAGTIGNYEQGQRLPRDDKQWIEIARFFNVSVDYLMDACPMMCDNCNTDCETSRVAYNGDPNPKKSKILKLIKENELSDEQIDVLTKIIESWI